MVRRFGNKWMVERNHGTRSYSSVLWGLCHGWDLSGTAQLHGIFINKKVYPRTPTLPKDTCPRGSSTIVDLSIRMRLAMSSTQLWFLRRVSMMFLLVRSGKDSLWTFSAVTYDKGSSLIRMLRTTLGEAIFQKGMQIYLQKYAFGNADHVKYFNAFTEVFI